MGEEQYGCQFVFSSDTLEVIERFQAVMTLIQRLTGRGTELAHHCCIATLAMWTLHLLGMPQQHILV